MPKTSRNSKTTAIRAKFLASVQNYRSLSPAGKFSFQVTAPSFERTNSLGEQYTLSTIQLAASQSFNAIENNEGLPVLASSPVVFQTISVAGSGWSIDPPTLLVVPSVDPIPPDRDLILWLSPADDWVLGSVPEARMRQALVVPSGHTGIIDLLPAYRQLFGEERWSIGQTMYIGMQQYAHFSGQKSSINYSLLGLAS